MMNDSFVDRFLGLGRIGALICGYLLLALSLLVGVEVISRKLFGFSLQGADELGGYVLAITGAVGFSYALICRAHTRIDVFLTRMPKAVQTILNLVAMFSITAFAVFMAWQAASAFAETLEYGSIANSPLATPLWIPQSIWLGGLLIFAVISATMSVWAAYLLIWQNDDFNNEYGVPGAPVHQDQESGGEHA